MSLISDVVAGTVITVTWGNGIRDQVIATFPDEATRNASIPGAPEGRYADCADLDALTRGNGATWDIIGHKPLFASLSANAAGITNNTVLGNIAGLSVPVLANRTYQMYADIVYDAAGGAGAAQMKAGWTGPAGATMIWDNIGLVVNGASAVSGTTTYDVSSISDARSFGAAGVGTPVHVVINGRLAIAATAGNLNFQAAQVVSSANATTIRAGSYIRLVILS